MQKFKNVENDIVKLKLFPFSLRGKVKDWLLPLPNGSINSWDNLKEDFIKKYYPPVQILQNRNIIFSFKQNDNEHVATSWERLKIMLRTCPSHGVNEWTVLHSFYNGLNYMSRSMLDSTGGAFMTKTVTEAKAILENMLQNFSQWHTATVFHTKARHGRSILASTPFDKGRTDMASNGSTERTAEARVRRPAIGISERLRPRICLDILATRNSRAKADNFSSESGRPRYIWENTKPSIPGWRQGR
jgi:hypothetical protein